MRENNWLSRFVGVAYKAVVSYIFFLILAALLFLSAFSTSLIDSSERIYFIADSVWFNILSLIAAMLISILLVKLFKGRLAAFNERLEKDDKLFFMLRRCILAALWVLLSIWALSTRLVSGGDQITVLDAAYGLAQRDFSALSPVNYLYDYNHQIGLAMVEFLLNRVLGEYNYTAYHLINAALIPLIYRELSMLGAVFGLKRADQLMILLVAILFTPLSLYISFIYGTLPGLLLALVAIRLELEYFRGAKWPKALLSALAICFAVLLKSNYMIFMLAMLIYGFVEILRTKKAEKLVLVLLIAVFYTAQARIPIAIFAQMRGADIPEGVSTWAWVTMGLQDGRNPGWYNGYTLDTLIGSEFDTQRQENWVKEDLKARIEELWNDKDAARDFFVRKTASQWNEPSFESVLILQGRSVKDENHWTRHIISEAGNYRLSCFLNYYNFMLLAGAALYMLLCTKTKCFHDSLILPMIIIGGFLFHLVWEAKGQYTLPYFVLLLPYTVMGYGEAARRVIRLPELAKSGQPVVSLSRSELLFKLTLLLLSIAILWYVFHGTMGSLTGGTEAYYEYLAAHS